MLELYDFPEELKKLLEKGSLEQISRGLSKSFIYKIENLSFADKCYLKVDEKGGLEREKEVLNWLKGKIPVPKVIYFSSKDRDFLLLEGIDGLDLVDALNHLSPDEILKILAEGLKIIHSVSIKSCPFDMRLDNRIREAERLVKLHLVDERNFEPENSSKTAEEILKEIVDKKPGSEELVFTHGDYCLPNIIVKNKKIAGFVDLGRAGVGDKYQDIALAARSILHNLKDKSYVEAFLGYLEIQNPDYEKIKYYILLDELF